MPGASAAFGSPALEGLGMAYGQVLNVDWRADPLAQPAEPPDARKRSLGVCAFF